MKEPDYRSQQQRFASSGSQVPTRQVQVQVLAEIGTWLGALVQTLAKHEASMKELIAELETIDCDEEDASELVAD